MPKRSRVSSKRSVPKRKRNRNIMADNAPEPKKLKVGSASGEPDPASNKNQSAKPVEKQKRRMPSSPIPGPSRAPSDPQLRMSYQAGLIPVYRYFDPKQLEDGSSQGSTSATEAAGTSTTETMSSTNVEVGDSRTASLEDMDVDTGTTSTSESSASARDRRQRQSRRRFRKRRSRRDE